MNQNEIEINGEIYVKKNELDIKEQKLNDVSVNVQAAKAFELMGYKILTIVAGTENGPDMHIKKDELIFRVEIKKARKSNRSMAVHPIENNRKNDDFVAVVFPSGYVFIEPMQDYLMNCADSGSRSFFGIY